MGGILRAVVSVVSTPEPVYEAAGPVHEKYPPGTKQRVLFTKIDCVVHQNFCMQQVITGYPTIRIFTHGTDILTHDGKKEHAFYRGPRTVDGLTQFVDTLVPTPEPVSDTPMEEVKERNLQLPYRRAWTCRGASLRPSAPSPV